MKEEKKEEIYWIRDKEGELIPIEFDLEITDKYLLYEIEQLKILKQAHSIKNTDKDKKQVLVIEEALKELDKELKNRTETHKVKFKPLINYQIDCIKAKVGINGKKVDDIEAQICSMNCVDPKYTYEQWRDMKNPKFKKHLSELILSKSLPEKPKISEAEKQAFRLIQGMKKEL